jgi:hypothetical protein
MTTNERGLWNWNQHLELLLRENAYDAEAIMLARLNILSEQNPIYQDFYEGIENSLKSTAWHASENEGGCNVARCHAAYYWFTENRNYLMSQGLGHLCDGYDPNHPWFSEVLGE